MLIHRHYMSPGFDDIICIHQGIWKQPVCCSMYMNNITRYFLILPVKNSMNGPFGEWYVRIGNDLV